MSSIVFRFVPSPTGNIVAQFSQSWILLRWDWPVGGQVGRTVEDLVALRTAVLNVDNHGAPDDTNIIYCTLSVLSSLCSPVLCQTKSIIVDLFTQATDVVSDLVLYLGQLLLGFFCHFDNIKLWVNVTWNIRIGPQSLGMKDEDNQIKPIAIWDYPT